MQRELGHTNAGEHHQARTLQLALVGGTAGVGLGGATGARPGASLVGKCRSYGNEGGT